MSEPTLAAARGRRCRTCAHWDDRGAMGLCRAHAPEPARLLMVPREGGKAREVLRGLWPITSDSDWCGEHREHHEDVPF